MVMKLAQIVAFGRSLNEYINMFDLFSGAEIKQRFNGVVDQIIDQVIATSDNWIGNYYRNPHEF